jgi:NAD-dependent dihydropyrimidine dehydrogenase PreA subunit
MCEFCSKHKRKKWFLDPDSYHEKLLEDKKRKNVLQKIVGYNLEYYMRDSANAIYHTKKPLIGRLLKRVIDKTAPAQHSGQVITLSDALEMVDLADNHVVFPCACRQLVGLKEKDCCLNFGPMRDLHKTVKFEKMEEIDSEEAKLRLKEWHKEGLVHQVLYAAAPFPIAICNCERKYCTSMKYRLSFDIKSALYKGHEIAFVDPLKCKCDDYPCISRCQFGAMYVDRYDNKLVIDPTRCFGCGLCVTACKYRAISLEPREKVLMEREEW